MPVNVREALRTPKLDGGCLAAFRGSHCQSTRAGSVSAARAGTLLRGKGLSSGPGWAAEPTRHHTTCNPNPFTARCSLANTTGSPTTLTPAAAINESSMCSNSAERRFQGA